MRESDKLQKLPFYLVCDVSYSMADGGRIQAVNDAMAEVRNALRREPLLADLAYFSLIDFSDQATVVIPLADLAEGPPPPPLQVRGGTSYAAAFNILRATIQSDVENLKTEFRVFRPTVFFLSDGSPQDSSLWPDALHNLTYYDPTTGGGFKYYPMIVPFGIGEADKQVLAKLVHPAERSRLYMAVNGQDVGNTVKVMVGAILASIMASAQTATGGTAAPQVKLPSPKELGPSIAVYTSDLDEL